MLKGISMKLVKVGNRRIYYAEIKILKYNYKGAGIHECKNLKEARAKIKQAVEKDYGNVKYKIIQLFRLPADMEIEEYEGDEK